MKRKKQNKIIEIAISEYIATSFTVKLEMSLQEKLDKNMVGETNKLLLLNQLKNETQVKKQNQTENFGSDIK